MTKNGSGRPVTLVLTLNPAKGTIDMKAPKDPAVAYAMLRAGLDMLFQQATSPEPERKVKTLDELIPGGRRMS